MVQVENAVLTRLTRVRANVVPAGSVLHYTCLPGHDLQVLYYADISALNPV